MQSIFKNKKQYQITEENKKRIKQEIEELSSLTNGLYSKIKEYPMAYYIKIIIDRNKIGIDLSDKKYSNIPDTIIFLLIIDYTYPNFPPKILAKSKRNGRTKKVIKIKKTKRRRRKKERRRFKKG